MSPTNLKTIRLLHNYFGVFLAPAILFFAITGSLQMFGLHETSRGSSYVPPDLLTHLSQLHKKGTLYLPARRPPVPEATHAKGEATKIEAPKVPQTAPIGPPHNALPIKIFFAITGVGLVISTLTGLVMAWKYARRKPVVTWTLVAGVVVPLLLLVV